jgi:ADP-dependent NAD(P)H-hydrate dehydratase
MRQELPADRQEQALQLSQRTNAIIVLKGAGTVVTDGEKVYINKTGNPGMATAGSGDVLTGIITALLGQGLSDFDAAVLGVYIHGLAGDIAAEKFGQVSLMTTDIIDSLPDAFLRYR